MKKQELQEYPSTFTVIFVWAAIFALCQFAPLFSLLEGCGITLINGQWYRLFSGWLLHRNLLHLAVNVIALYHSGSYLERILGSKKFLCFAIGSALLSECALSCIVFPDGINIMGGSILVFTCLGMILVLLNCGYPKIRLHTGRGDWLLGYAILGNLPLIPMVQIGTVITHLLSCCIGIVLGFLYVKLQKQDT